MEKIPTVTDLLRRYPATVVELAEAARQYLKERLPGISEEVDISAGLLGYGYGSGYKGVVCTLILSQKGVKMGFFHGASLPDPACLLQGTGKVHRYVPLYDISQLTNPALAALLEAALSRIRA